MALKPDVAVIQEACRTTTYPDSDVWVGPSYRAGLSIIARDPYTVTAAPVDINVIWSVAPFRVDGPTSFNLLAVWTKQPPGYRKSLTDALDAYAGFLTERPSVVMGDFNDNAFWDSPRKPMDFTRQAARLTEDFGLRSAYHHATGRAYGRERQPTHYFTWNRRKPFHLDYCFAPKEWEVERVRVGGYEKWAALSDHRPVVVDFDAGSVTCE